MIWLELDFTKIRPSQQPIRILYCSETRKNILHNLLWLTAQISDDALSQAYILPPLENTVHSTLEDSPSLASGTGSLSQDSDWVTESFPNRGERHTSCRL